MTRDEAIARVEALAADLEKDLADAQNRVQHMALAQRIADARAIAADLRARPAA